MLFKFVAGNKLLDSLKVGNKLIKNQKIPIINYISENKKSEKHHVYNELNQLINQVNQNYMIALKLSSIDFDINYANNLSELCKTKQINLVIDAEENSNYYKSRDLVNNLILKYDTVNNDTLKNSFRIFKTYQMYRRDSLLELHDDFEFFNKRNKKLSAKIVRGAYFNQESNDGHLYDKKKDTDTNYNLAILKCSENNNNFHILATHNKYSIDLAKKLNNNQFIIANLMGMNENYINNLDTKLYKATYVPYGPYKDMIPYLTRRLYENLDIIKYTIQ